MIKKYCLPLLFLMCFISGCGTSPKNGNPYLLSDEDYKQLELQAEVIKELTLKYGNKGLQMEKWFDSDEKATIQPIEIIQSGPKLVFRFSNMNCMVCVDSVFSSLNKSGLHPEDVAVLCDIVPDGRNVKLFREKYDFEGKMYVQQGDGTDFKELNESGFPYFFLLDKCLSLNRFFIPNKYESNATKEYLIQIQSLLDALDHQYIKKTEL